MSVIVNDIPGVLGNSELIYIGHHKMPLTQEIVPKNIRSFLASMPERSTWDIYSSFN